MLSLSLKTKSRPYDQTIVKTNSLKLNDKKSAFRELLLRENQC